MKYILPNFYDNFSLNSTLIKEYISSIKIGGIQGTYPFAIFNGWYNNIRQEDIAVYQDINNILNDYAIISNHVYIDCGNLLLRETDFFNAFEKVVLETLSSSKNIYFEVADINLLEYLISTYPDIQIILHQNFTMWHTEEQIKLALEYYKNIVGIIITDTNPCINIQNTEKIYLLHLNKCEECPQLQECLMSEMNSILEYSTKSIFNDCIYYDYHYPKELIEKIKITSKEYNYNCLLFDSQCVDRYTTENNIMVELFKLIKEENL